MKTKKPLSTLLLFFFFISSHAQFKLPVSTGNADVRQALERVLAEFPTAFATLKGEIRSSNPQVVEYSSLLLFKSAEENTIVQHPGKLPVYSWQALMFRAEDFADAEKKYQQLYRQLKGMTLTLNRDYSYQLKGDYDKPDESRRFSSTVFQLLPAASSLPKMRVELSMQYEMPEWKISLLVYQHQRDDKERGPVEE